MDLALALAITLRARRAILSLPWTAQHQSNTIKTATGFTWHPFVVARWVRVYSSRSQSIAPLSILPKVVGKNSVKQWWAPRNAHGSLASVYTQFNYKHGAHGEITFFSRRLLGGCTLQRSHVHDIPVMCNLKLPRYTRKRQSWQSS